MVLSVKLNGTSIKRPSSFKIERYKVTNLQRLANGDMAGDLISKKRKFYFTYDAITSDDIQKILGIIWEINSIFYTLEYVEDNVVKTATVYTGSMPDTLIRTGGCWVWKDVSIDFIEK